jgi:excisionase family DNA binding protein
MIDTGDRLLTINEVLALAGISRYTLYRDIKAGKLPALYVGRNVRIWERDAKTYAAEKGNSKSVSHYKEKVNSE